MLQLNQGCPAALSIDLQLTRSVQLLRLPQRHLRIAAHCDFIISPLDTLLVKPGDPAVFEKERRINLPVKQPLRSPQALGEAFDLAQLMHRLN